jgi:NADPH:quinone reductase-like Zn-dependent oxidoreductase
MYAFGPDPASLTCQEIPVPDAGPGELLVQVRATAVTAGELTWPQTWPAIPCHDVSGVVAATGAGVTGWRPGDQVYGLIGFDRPGAAAGYVTAPPLSWPPSRAASITSRPPPSRSARSPHGRHCTSTRGCGPVSTCWCTAASAPTSSSSPRCTAPG